MNSKSFKSRYLSAFLAVLMILTMLPAGSITAFASTDYTVKVTGTNNNFDVEGIDDLKNAKAGDTINLSISQLTSGIGFYLCGIDATTDITIEGNADNNWDSENDRRNIYFCNSYAYFKIPEGYDVESVSGPYDVFYYSINLKEATSGSGSGSGSGSSSGSGSATITYTKAKEINGTVALSGTEKVGQQLTASYTYADGTGTGDYTVKYEWYRVGDASEQLITTETNGKYTLADADKDNKIKVVVKLDTGDGNWRDADTNISATSGTIGVFSEAYTLTFPSSVTVTGSDFTALGGEFKVEGSDFTPDKVVTVTAASQHTDATGWYLASSTVDSKIHYNLLTSAAGTHTDSFTFGKTAIEAGTVQTIGVKASAADMAGAKAGTYTDTITFTAALTAGN